MLTDEEKVKIERKVEISEMLDEGFTSREIVSPLKTSEKTVSFVRDKKRKYSKGFDLVTSKSEKLKNKDLER